MRQTYIPPSSFKFLKQLAKNNDREWFKARKALYLKEQAHLLNFTEALLEEMAKIDNIEGNTPKNTLYRIYRDTRFSKNKTPYKNHFSGGIKRPTKQLRGGYYFHIEPGNCQVGGGFWGPNPADLKLIRSKIDQDPQSFRKILKAASFKKNFGELLGDKLKTAPRGFDVEHPAIDLLRYKQYYVMRSFTDKEVQDPTFLKEMIKTWKAIRPFFDHMSDVLTTDLNGIPLYE